jgi:ATP-dependent DNA helicase 2 subunit 2
LPSLKLYSDRAPASDPTATHDMERITAYKSTVDPDREVPPAEHTKAYRYGPQFIPVDQHVEEGLKFRAEKGVKVIGFTHKQHVPRWVPIRCWFYEMMEAVLSEVLD